MSDLGIFWAHEKSYPPLGAGWLASRVFALVHFGLIVFLRTTGFIATAMVVVQRVGTAVRRRRFSTSGKSEFNPSLARNGSEPANCFFGRY
jgi:hypothetical protein